MTMAAGTMTVAVTTGGRLFQITHIQSMVLLRHLAVAIWPRATAFLKVQDGVVVSECLLQSQEEDTAVTICQACMPSSPLLSELPYVSMCNVSEFKRAPHLKAFVEQAGWGAQDQVSPEPWA